MLYMIKLFTDSDLDGLGCGLIAKLAYGDNVIISYCTYHNLNRRVDGTINNPENDEMEIFITDLSVNKDVEAKLKKRYKQGKHIKMIDHHVTANHFNEYEWGHVQAEYDDGRKTCATSLFYEYMIENGKMERNIALEEFIELVRQYDTWEWEETNNTKAKRLNDLFFIVGRESFEVEMYNRLKGNPNSFSFNELEQKILEIEEKKIERYIHSKNRRMVQSFIEDYCVGIVHAESYISELGNELMKKNPHLDLIAILNVGNKSMGFRTIYDHVDVSEFAQKFGGGGHPKASGSGLTEDTFKQFVIDVFNHIPRLPEPDQNEYNVPKSEYGTYYVNRKKEITMIKPISEGKWEILHSDQHAQNFETFDEAERYVKRQFDSSLQFDNDYLKYMAGKLKVSENELKSKYGELMKKELE